MNVLTWIILLILAAFTLSGWSRGFVRVFAGMFFFLASTVLVYYATPYISDFIKENTPIYQAVEENCREMLKGGEGQENSGLEQKKFIEGLGLPEALEKQLLGGSDSGSSVDRAVEGVSDYLAEYMAGLILNILTFVVTLAVVNLVLRMTVLTLDNLAKLPVLNSINKAFGMVLGAAQGLLVVWVAFLVITAFGNTDAGRKLLEMIHESPILDFLYNINIFLKIMLRMMAEMF
ncbi:CvpA family protein [Hominisplanchenecus murintestinalis]|uniref:CvpA family protein n=1 Tax=Hominisplanchenecus murintestinalis TaxID=2941517 RepID=A0AC61QWN7_9FIRM|nr:CvpA family protein [Hominisplanchenecus murintestinalis]NBH98693.1 CvpA family protein [Lachnospiraceae bacterium]NBI75923.1 CvpA family protein [Lachnospiraceae bacterium]RKJ88689.1 CvpA family protein [Anaerotruncus sp. 1XD22-93]TGX97239.1 CvpA family protein [Hominisplanchenecus murintestinalis]